MISKYMKTRREQLYAISISQNFYKRKILGSPVCPIGGWEVEIVEHLLLLCSWTNVVWFGAPSSYKVDMRGFSSVDRQLMGVINLQGISKRDSTSAYKYQLHMLGNMEDSVQFYLQRQPN